MRNNALEVLDWLLSLLLELATFLLAGVGADILAVGEAAGCGDSNRFIISGSVPLSEFASPVPGQSWNDEYDKL